MNFQDNEFDSFFNKEQKKEFLISKYSHMNDKTLKSIVNFFNVIGVFEDQYRKDFCNFTFEDIISLFERCGWGKTATFSRNKSLLNSYIEWCKITSKISNDIHPIERLKISDIKNKNKFERESFSSFEDLKDCLDFVYDSTDNPDRFIFDKLMFCLSWIGFKKEEMQFLKKTDVDFINNSIKCETYCVHNIDPYIIELINTCIEATTLPRLSFNTGFALNDNNFLMRTCKSKRLKEYDIIPDSFFNNAASRFRNITKDFSPVDKYFKKIITPTTVFDNGRYYDLYNYEKTHKEVNYNDIIILSEIGRIDINNETGLYNFHKDYKYWKEYFYKA